MLTEHEMKPLVPLTHGIIVLAGVKASNLSEEIRNHPRVTVWDSQHEHWISKDLPSNTRAVFMTKFIGHAAFKNIVAQARKRNITIFNPQGTGIITRQVRELLALNLPVSLAHETEDVVTTKGRTEMTLSEFMGIDETRALVKPSMGKGKLQPLMQFINPSLKPIENARILFHKSKEMGIDTTLASLAQMVAKQARDAGTRHRAPYARHPRVKQPIVAASATETRVQTKEVDVSVQILDEMIRGLQDMRTFLVATVEENTSLKMRLATLKKVFSE